MTIALITWMLVRQGKSRTWIYGSIFRCCRQPQAASSGKVFPLKKNYWRHAAGRCARGYHRQLRLYRNQVMKNECICNCYFTISLFCQLQFATDQDTDYFYLVLQCLTKPEENIWKRIKEIIFTIIKRLQQPNLSNDDIDSVHFQVDNVYHLVLKCDEIYSVEQDVIDMLRQAKTIIEGAVTEDNGGFKSPLVSNGLKGRPSYNIPKSQLEFYFTHGFSIEQISKMIGVSSRSIKRRMKDSELSVSELYTTITDECLDELIKNKLKDFPNSGYRRMNGLLISSGIRIQEARLRKAMQRTDPEGVLLRTIQLQLVHRRKYAVRGPLSLWHIDGHHKLIT